MKKYYFLILAFFCFCLLFLYVWPKVQLAVIEHNLKSHYKKCTGKEIHYSNIYIKSDRTSVIIENPRLSFAENCVIIGTEAQLSFKKPISLFFPPSFFDFYLPEAKFHSSSMEEMNCDLKAHFNKTKKICCFMENRDTASRLEIMISRDKKNTLLEAKAKDISAEVVHSLISSYLPEYSEIRIESGTLNGYMACLFVKNRFDELQVEFSLDGLKGTVDHYCFNASKLEGSYKDQQKLNQIFGEEVKISLIENEISLFLPELLGTISKDSSGIVTFDLSIDKGSIDIYGFSHLIALYNSTLQFTQNGIITNFSHGNFNLQGLSGSFDLSRTLQSPCISIELNDRLSNLNTTLLNQNYFNPFIQKLKEETLDLITQINYEEDAWKVDGILILSNSDLFTFQGSFGHSLVQNSLTFTTNEIPLGKYIVPLIPSHSLSIEGEAQFSGLYKEGIVYINSSCTPFEISCSPFDLTLKNASLAATLDLDKGIPYCELKFSDSIFLEKHSMLLFKSFKGDLSFENRLLKINNLYTSVEDILLTGDLTADLKNCFKGIIDIDIHNYFYTGKFSDVQKVVSLLPVDTFLTKLPLEGRISSGNKESHYRFSITPEACAIEALIEGNLTEAYILGSNKNFGLCDISLDYIYDHKSNLLHLKDIQGAFLVGSSHQREDYYLMSDEITFSDFIHNKMQFDFWIGDRSRDILRLAGTAHSLDSEEILVNFDPKISHLGIAHPQKFSLVLSNWKDLKAMDLYASFNLDDIFNECRRLSQLNFSFVPKNIPSLLNQINKASGNCCLSLQLAEKELNFSANVDCLCLDDTNLGPFTLIGEKRENRITLEHCQINDVCISADIHEKKNSLLIDFIGLQYDHLILSGCTGEFFPEEKILKVNLDLIDVDLNYLGKLHSVSPYLFCCDPKGNIRLKGKAQLDFQSNLLHPKLSGYFESNFRSFELCGIGFEHDHNIKCSFNTEKGFKFEPFQVKNKKTGKEFKIDEILYTSKNRKLSVSGCFKGVHFHFNDCEAKKNELVISNIEFDNSYGLKGKCNLKLFNEKNKWYCSVPLLDAQIHNQNQNFLIDHIEIKNMEGCVESLNSFKGEGKACFKSLGYFSEYLLGVEDAFKLLTPSSGMAYFKIQNGKFVIKKLKDVVNHDYTVKFCLGKNVSNSINFNGDLDLHVGLHPYNMFVKLPEVASIKLRGNLKKPICTFTKN